jgi:hypothetical protein
MPQLLVESCLTDWVVQEYEQKGISQKAFERLHVCKTTVHDVAG